MPEPLVVLVTGANQGLGYLASEILAKTGQYHVLAGARDLSKGKAAVEKILQDKNISSSTIEAIEVDLGSDSSCQRAAKTIDAKFGKLDILLNNAGVAIPSGESVREQYTKLFDTNVAGTATITEAVLPLLRKSKASSPGRRIVFVSTGLASLTWGSDPKHKYVANGWPMYRASKAALNMLALYYTNTLRDEGIAVTLTTPGFCATNLNGFSEHANESPEVGARQIVKAATEGENMEVTGSFTWKEGTVPW